MPRIATESTIQIPLIVACAVHASAFAETMTFGSGVDAFSMQFTQIGHANNVADTTGVPVGSGRVTYAYSIGTFEVSREQILKANAQGGLGIQMLAPAGAGNTAGTRPAGGISWNEAARFVNWLNTSYGFMPAYKFTSTAVTANSEPWIPGDYGYDAANAFRNRGARFVLPTSDEWYKAAYYNPQSGTYSKYATGSDSTPAQVMSGTLANTAVFALTTLSKPADVTNCGGLSAFGTMGQGGNMWEWEETALDQVNSDGAESRGLRGGAWNTSAKYMARDYRNDSIPGFDSMHVGFRVALVPTPGAAALVVVAASLSRRRRVVS